MKIMIQPREQWDGKLPYPYWINADQTIGRQDFWEGRPYMLIGFANDYVPGEIDLSFADFWANPKLAVGKHPVFSDKKHNWFTAEQIIDRVQVRD